MCSGYKNKGKLERYGRILSYVEIMLLGAGLATDASCVCTSNGLVYRPKLYTILKMSIICALFQFIMPVIGYLGASLLPPSIYQYNPVIACILLCYIGVKMIMESYRDSRKVHEVYKEQRENTFTNKILFSQGIATSIDALSVGFAFHAMTMMQVVNASIIIATVTFVMCFIFAKIGGYIGNKINSKAELLGGSVLILLGVKMLIG